MPGLPRGALSLDPPSGSTLNLPAVLALASRLCPGRVPLLREMFLCLRSPAALLARMGLSRTDWASLAASSPLRSTSRHLLATDINKARRCGLIAFCGHVAPSAEVPPAASHLFPTLPSRFAALFILPRHPRFPHALDVVLPFRCTLPPPI
jgi:hypothetical protein